MSFYESLLQSEKWQTLQSKHGKRCLREQGTLFIVETLPLVGHYLYAPRWPNQDQRSRIKDQKAEIENLARRENAGWIRVEPENESALEELRNTFGVSQVVSAPHTVQPKEILVMDIQRSTEDLLAQMKSKTRYNTRLSEKHGVSVRFSRSSADMEQFISLIYATTERKAIRPHPKEYYRNFFEVFGDDECVLALAEHEGRVLAANLLVFHDGVAYYLHGGSSDEGRHLMAPYLLQWRSIEEAKRCGCTHYNFGGVDTQSNIKNQISKMSDWSGITRFKQGFAPNTLTLSFPGAYDIVISPLRYRFYRLLQKLQKVRRYFF